MRFGLKLRARLEEVRDRVHDHHAGLELLDQLVQLGQVRLQAVGGGAGGVETQQSLLQPGGQVEADGAHVADHLAFRLLEGEIRGMLAAPACRVGKMPREARLAGARGAGDEHAAAAIDPLAAQHGVEPRYARGDPLLGCLVLQAQRGDRQDGDARLVDQERDTRWCRGLSRDT